MSTHTFRLTELGHTLITVLLLVGTVWGALLLLGTTQPVDTTRTLPACAQEDSVGCHWDADTQGNGKGRSFDVDDAGHVTYTD